MILSFFWSILILILILKEIILEFQKIGKFTIMKKLSIGMEFENQFKF